MLFESYSVGYGPLDAFSPVDSAFLDYGAGGSSQPGAEPSTAPPLQHAPPYMYAAPMMACADNLPGFAPGPAAHHSGYTFMQAHGGARTFDMLPAQPRMIRLHHPAPSIPAELYPMEPPAFAPHEYAHSLALAESWHGPLLDATPLAPAVPYFQHPSVSPLPSPGGSLWFHHMAPPPPHEHAQFMLQEGPSTPPVWAISPQGSFAGAFELSTGQFYYGTEHPRLRTPQACEPCRQRKAKCSGQRPMCKRCADKGKICVYKEPDMKKAKSVTAKKPVKKAGNSDDEEFDPRASAASCLSAVTDASATSGLSEFDPRASVDSTVSALFDPDARRGSVASFASDSSASLPPSSPEADAAPPLPAVPAEGSAPVFAPRAAATPGSPSVAPSRRRPPPLDLGTISNMRLRSPPPESPVTTLFMNPWSADGALPTNALQPSPLSRERMPSLVFSEGLGTPLSPSPIAAVHPDAAAFLRAQGGVLLSRPVIVPGGSFYASHSQPPSPNYAGSQPPSPYYAGSSAHPSLPMYCGEFVFPPREPALNVGGGEPDPTLTLTAFDTSLEYSPELAAALQPFAPLDPTLADVTPKPGDWLPGAPQVIDGAGALLDYPLGVVQ